jgi:hypothetical protein
MTDSADILTNFCTALMTAFNAVDGSGDHNAFWTAVNGQLFKGRAPAGTAYPYSIFFVVSHNPDKVFAGDRRELLVQFSHFSADQNSSAEAENINYQCNALFDECAAFSITGWALELMKMTSSPGAQVEDWTTPAGESSGWHCPTDFEVTLRKT